MAGHSTGFRVPPTSQKFQGWPQFSGFMKPCRFEGDVRNLEVIGAIPKEIHGTFFRVMPDPALPPYIDNDPWFNGDGSVSAFFFEDGNCDFKQRYVRTEKFEKEGKARKALMGKYRNKYTDAIEFQVRTTSNTNVVYYDGKLLACKEDGLPYAMDPVTLETLCYWDFEGQIPSMTFTAHPKFDPITREMICFGYEAKGDGTPDICYYVANPNGKVNEIVWLVSPVVAMIHDFAVTENYVIFPVIPQTCSLERMKDGGEHWQWNPDIPCYFGVLPRRGAKGTDVKWFRSPNAFPGHLSNAFENKDGHIVVDLPMCDKNAFFWWPDASGNAPSPEEITSHLKRFTIDPESDDMDLGDPRLLLELNLEFPRIDDRFAMQDYSHVFLDIFDPSLPTNFPVIAPVMGGGSPVFNAIGHFNVKTAEYSQFFAGPTSLVQEPIFLPRSARAPEGDGYIMVLVNRYETMTSDLVIIDTGDMSTPVATIKLPVRLRAGLHGNWVDAADVDGHPRSLGAI
ncbi:carotenoid oxygenase [Penicillium verhagenii]|uniref:carotenoid oxygenase n=1 Tax=Penicillium verhagenii TaxID=1562060 RepID=UPI0025452D49|nr:carotenoid oxygenase [Penicillium verhagenii]KAJ5930420.1 carotenoid oxygenase [Penicillium verhagenii]